MSTNCIHMYCSPFDACTYALGQLGQQGHGYQTKDSGERQVFSTGMTRDIQTNKPRYDLVDWPMITRWAELMQRGALKYGEDNWKKAETEEELNRFKASALRHCIQYFCGETDEDHGAAVMFNLSGAEMVRNKLNKQSKP